MYVWFICNIFEILTHNNAPHKLSVPDLININQNNTKLLSNLMHPLDAPDRAKRRPGFVDLLLITNLDKISN